MSWNLNISDIIGTLYNISIIYNSFTAKNNTIAGNVSIVISGQFAIITFTSGNTVDRIYRGFKSVINAIAGKPKL
jgi:hypothetical protein